MPQTLLILRVNSLRQALWWTLIYSSSHLIGKINLLLAVCLLFDLALLGQLIQSLHHRLAEGRVKQLERARAGEIPVGDREGGTQA